MTARAQPLEARVREASGDPAGALVLLHGRGADEHDLYPLLDQRDPERRLLGVTPRGPLSLPPGGRHWYALGGIPTPDQETFLSTAPRLASFLDALPVPAERVVIGGFSQGTVMSWAMSLGPDRPRPAPTSSASRRRSRTWSTRPGSSLCGRSSPARRPEPAL